MGKGSWCIWFELDVRASVLTSATQLGSGNRLAIKWLLDTLAVALGRAAAELECDLAVLFGKSRG
jgi:hypothetical protein